jgi:UDP-galactopyranose mutase
LKKALVIGGGFTGCTSALELSKKNWDVTLLEKNNFLGAGNRTFFYKGHPYTFGPRHFLTQDHKLYEYLSNYVPMRSCAEHEFLTLPSDENNFFNYPINFNDIDNMNNNSEIKSELSEIYLSSVSKSKENINYWDYHLHNGASEAKNFEDFWIKSVGKTLYNKFINDYSKKMWMLNDNKEIDDFTWSPKGVTIKKGGKECWSEAISAYPIAINGYDDFFRLATTDVNVLLNTSFDQVDIDNKIVFIKGEKFKYDLIVNTISIDHLMDYQYGELPFIGRDLIKLVLPIEFALPKNVYFAYYADDMNYTRVVEYKKFTKYINNQSTLISLEIPSTNNKHYPLPIQKYIDVFNKYKKELPNNFYTIGRAGAYMYNVDIDDAIDQSLKMIEQVES